ncbi:Hint domain-containing protein [Algirhabdus cladophorae]|uniref:Hint domain-containing protein n=1 Tax=Algirhabdus cladophorae TaxID=3377108 RepID=UPI003B847496
MENETIDISAEDLAFVNSVLSSGTDLYRAYDRMLPYLTEGTDRYFWFQQASIINQQATGTLPPSDNNLSSTYIIAHSAYGLALDGFNNDLGATSNAIAGQVLADISASGGIIPLSDMLANDISAALDTGNQTIGGWGGSFYYWDLEYQGSTVGAQILANPADLEKFLLSSAIATMAVVRQELGEGATIGEIRTVVSTGLSSALPADLKEEIALLVIDGLFYGDIISNSDTFGRWTYDRTNDEFYWIVPEGSAGAGERLVASGDEEAALRERREVRLEVEGAGFDIVDVALARLGLVGQIPEGERCFLAGTMITMWDGSLKPIEEVAPDDIVTSYDAAGEIVPGRVTRTFKSRHSVILDVFGLMVTPGHITYCADGPFDGRHVAMIDILRSDGAMMRVDGTKVRASTGCDVGSELDQVVQVVAGQRTSAGLVVTDHGQMRLGSRILLEAGTDLRISDILTAMGATLDADGLVAVQGAQPAPLCLDFVTAVPRPEEYILARSNVTAEDLAAVEGRELGVSDAQIRRASETVEVRESDLSLH